MTDGNDSPGDDEERTSGGLLGAIRLIVDTLVEAEREDRTTFGKTDRIQGDHFTTEYGFSGRIGGARRQNDSPPGSRSPDSRSSSRSTVDSTAGSDDQHLIEVRETDDELLVVADMPDVEPGDITAGIGEERNEFVVGVGDEVVERMELPWPAEDVEAQFQHGILELRFVRAEDEE